jgi:hypothetical protein
MSPHAHKSAHRCHHILHHHRLRIIVLKATPAVCLTVLVDRLGSGTVLVFRQTRDVLALVHYRQFSVIQFCSLLAQLSLLYRLLIYKLDVSYPKWLASLKIFLYRRFQYRATVSEMGF